MKKTKVLFLDIDGVLCTNRAHEAFNGVGLMQHLDPVAVRLLDRLLRETNTLLVLSSTWREFHDQQSMTAIFQNAGFGKVPWHQNWKTPVLSRKKMSLPVMRGDEVIAWMENSGVPDQYVIIDDNNDFHDNQKERLVLTDAYDGLLWKDYEKAKRLLK